MVMVTVTVTVMVMVLMMVMVMVILSTFVEGLHWRGGLIVEHVPQKSSHHLESDKCGVCSTLEERYQIVTFYA
jgi:hypothetical protein